MVAEENAPVLRKKSLAVILAEDDEDDFLLTKEALQEAGLDIALYRVKNGEELIDCLRRRGAFQGRSIDPVVILLDLNMPKKDGREALKEIKSDASLRLIPVVVLTNSKAPEDIQRSYDLGVNSFIRKPTRFDQFVEVVKTLKQYWFDVVELPFH
jgi:CheY-like chemotaxis protein